MSSERTAQIEGLIEALIENRLDAGGRRRLAECAADPAVATDLRMQVATSNMLRLQLGQVDSQAQAARIVAVAHSNRHSRRIAAANAITRRIRDRGVAMRPRRGGMPRAMIGFAIAASLIFAAFLAVMVGKPQIPQLIPHQAPSLAESQSQPQSQSEIVREVRIAVVVSGQARPSVGSPLVAGASIHAGDDFSVADELRITLNDGSTLVYTPGRYGFATDSTGIVVRLDSGTVTAEVTPQRAGRNLRFVTPQALATVLGTRLSLRIDHTGTRLDVEHGRVHLRGLHDDLQGGLVVVTGGNATVGLDSRMIRAAPLPSRPAMPASTLGSMVGLNLNLNEVNDTAGRRFSDLLARLTTLGVRQLRTDVPTTDASAVAQWRQIAALDCEVCAVVQDLGCDPAQLPERFGGALRMLAGPHEPDRLDPAFSLDALRVNLAALSQRMRVATPKLRLVGPTFVDSGMTTRMGDCSALFDATAFAHMLAGRHPETDGWGDGGYGSVAWAMREAAGAGARLPVVMARAGYHDAVRADSNHPGVPDDVLAIYLPRLILAYAAAGVQRAYIAELIDREAEGITGAWGLLRRDGTPKPAYEAVRELLAVCVDVGASTGTAPSGVAVAVEPADTYRSLLLTRRDGACLLALWLPTPCWDPVHSVPIAVTPKTVRVYLNGPDYRLNHHLIGRGLVGTLAPVASAGNAFVDVSISDRLSILEISSDSEPAR